MITAGALLIAMTVWWMAVVGDSVPARRPFLRPEDQVPTLIEQATTLEAKQIFEYSLHGGWPTGNSAVRLLACIFAVFASFSFAYLASFLKDKQTRLVFLVVLALVVLFSFISFIMDTLSIVRTAKECNDKKCTTAVPAGILNSNVICDCAPDAWFYLTIVLDVLLLISAATCLFFTVRPLFNGGVRYSGAN